MPFYRKYSSPYGGNNARYRRPLGSISGNGQTYKRRVNQSYGGRRGFKRLTYGNRGGAPKLNLTRKKAVMPVVDEQVRILRCRFSMANVSRATIVVILSLREKHTSD